MSASPHPAQDTNTPTAASASASSASTNVQLSTLLTESLNENEVLKKELTSAKKRADRAERLLQAMNEGTTTGSPTTELNKRVLLEYEDKWQRAEQAREEAESRRRIVLENWQQLNHWLQTVEVRTQDVRESFSRILKDGGGSLSLTAIPFLSVPSMPPPPPPSSQPSRRHTARTPMTPFPALPLPPLPPTTTRRARTPSLESDYTHPPSKRPRGNGEPRLSYSDSHIHMEHGYPPPTQSGPRIILSPGHHHKPHPHHPHSHQHPHHHRRPHSRSSSRSSSASLDVDEMLLRASTADEINGAQAMGNAPPMASLPLPNSQNGSPHMPTRHHSRRHVEEPSRRVHVYQGPAQEGSGYAYPASQSVPRKELMGGLQPAQQSQQPGQQQAGPLPQPGQVQQYQTHVFAPVVTGAPMKKPKYSVSGGSIGAGGSVSNANVAGAGGSGPGSGPIDTAPIVAPPAPVFPATNAQGQRICRQCGLPGRYKDNKCVEKWGPGPMGPGTVCDRCRKKMKRVERRGTLETQQQMAVMQQHQHQQQQPSRPGSMSGQQLPLSQGSDRSIHRSDTILTHHGGGGSFSQQGREQSQSQTQSQGREHSQTQSQPHSQPQSQSRSAHSHPHSSHMSHLRTSSATQSVASPKPSPPPSIAAFDEDEGEDEDAEHEREQDHDGEDGDSEQLPLSNVGRGGRVGSRSRAGLRNGGAIAAGAGRGGAAAAAGRKGTPVGSGGRTTPAGRSTPVVGGRSTPAGRSTPSGARRTTPAKKKSPLGMDISPTTGMEVDETDADADADAEAEAEAEILGAVEATAGGVAGDQEMVDADGDGDAEAELLEAVDAAEANSSSSSSHGGAAGAGWMKEEEDVA